ncbi:phage holin family protein [Streptomyces aidingensis]|uniref:PH domain-containing protein n=1 Tax=Streptomyces aidingensis TaxID=910347 RepID=A0A1I1NZL1_9ACTN|nr:phage holin family protein [Streptomyces aidingensis]SFD03134.1 PH domain-containing protein [Streptomyces aidingensis]
MTLSFMAADRTRDPSRRDMPLPHAPQDHWRRPYRIGPWRVGISAVTLLLASFILMSAMIIALAGQREGGLATLILAVLAIAFALRLLRVGIWVSPRGLRQVNLLMTRTLKWRDVTRVRTAQQPVRWLSMPRTVQGEALEIERRRGEPLRTLLTTHSADFLGRYEAFDRAADVIEAWAAEHR